MLDPAPHSGSINWLSAYRRVQIISPITTIAAMIHSVALGFPSAALIEYAIC